jgi:hypothetical protein
MHILLSEKDAAYRIWTLHPFSIFVGILLEASKIVVGNALV